MHDKNIYTGWYLEASIARRIAAKAPVVELINDRAEQLYFEAQAALDFDLGAIDPADYADPNAGYWTADEANVAWVDEFHAAGIAWDTPTSAVYGTGFDYEALLDGFSVTARGGRRLLALVD